MELLDVSKSYGDKKVLSSLTLHIKERATTVLSGPSGIGKTTLFRLILGLEKADCGTIRTEGRVSALFQEDRLIENLSIMNNLLLVSDDKARMKELLKESGLEGEEKNRVATLSGGMKRRVALVRALLTDYDTLLLDEGNCITSRTTSCQHGVKNNYMAFCNVAGQFAVILGGL